MSGLFFASGGGEQMLRALFAVLVLAGCQTTEDKQNYRQAQIDIVAVQAEQNRKAKDAQAAQRAELYRQMVAVSQANPEVADAIAVGLALAAADLNADQGRGDSITSLKTESNTPVEIARALGPAALTVVGQLGVAAISADVQRTMSNNQARTQQNRDNVMGGIVTGVTSMAEVAIDGAGTDYYLSDEAFVDNSVNNTTSSSTTNTTSGDTTTNLDSYNTTSTSTVSGDTNTDSFNQDNDTTSTTTNTTTSTETNTTTTTSTETNTTTDTTSTETNTTDSYNTNTNTFTTSAGDSLTPAEILGLVQDGAAVTVLVDGEWVVITTEEAACSTFGGDACP